MYPTIMLILEPKFRFRALKADMQLFDPWKYTFSSNLQNSRSMDTAHDHTGFGVQFLFLGSKGLYLPLLPLKAYILYSFYKIPDRWITITRFLTVVMCNFKLYLSISCRSELSEIFWNLLEPSQAFWDF
jgi:hypothetical protein